MDTQLAPQPPYNSSAETMTIVKSKVIFTSIPPKASSKELSSFIRSTLRSSSLDNSPLEDPLQALESVQIEKHPDGTQKSHAFLVFETYEMAQAIVNLLDGVKFHGKALKVKLAKEGTASGTRAGTGAKLRSVAESLYVGGSSQGHQHGRQQSDTSTRSSRKLSRGGFEMMDVTKMSSSPQGSVPKKPVDTKMPGRSDSCTTAHSAASSRASSYNASTPDKQENDKTDSIPTVVSSSSAAVAAAAKMRETSPDTPLVVDGSSPLHSS
jgi:RNA recognition motif-containing protein